MNADRFIVRSNLASKWKWRFKRDHVYLLPFKLDNSLDPLTIESNAGNTLVSLRGDQLKIKKNYHFDGATYAPDFKGGLMAFALHDALLQLHDNFPYLVTTYQANEAFKYEMQRQRFFLWPLYYAGVKLWFAIQ